MKCCKHTLRLCLSSGSLTCWRWPPSAVSLFPQAGSEAGCAGRQEAAEDQSQQGSSTGCLQHGHHTVQGGSEAARRRLQSLSRGTPSAATHPRHMKWEHGRMRRATHSWSQAGQRDDCSQHSLPFSFSSFLFESSLLASRSCRCCCWQKVFTDIIIIWTTLLLDWTKARQKLPKSTSLLENLTVQIQPRKTAEGAFGDADILVRKWKAEAAL